MSISSEDLSDLSPLDDVQEAQWEDVSDAEETSQSEVMSSNAAISQRTRILSLRKKRRIQTKTTFLASPTPSKNLSIKGRKKPTIAEPEVVQKVLVDGARYTTSYAYDGIKYAIEKMRRPFGWCIFMCIFSWLFSFAIQRALSPWCNLPWISRSSLCVPVEPFHTVNFEKLVDIQGSTFEQLVGETAEGSQISIEVLKAEMATQDLALLVQYSDLKSKGDITDMLRTIAGDAKKTGRGLSKLNAKVVGAIDEVMALNSYAMATIESAPNKAPWRLLRAISPVSLGPTAEETIAEAFTLAMDESERAMAKLIVEAEASWQNLEQLDVDIGTLHEMITREGKYTTTERDKLLGELWTKLGGNKRAVRDNGDRLALLNDIGEYRRQAVAHVKAALRALHTMSDDLEVLRERVAAPGLLEGKLPPQVHMESIRNGLERLQEGRVALRGREAATMLLTADSG